MASIIFDQETRSFSVVDETREYTNVEKYKGKDYVFNNDGNPIRPLDSYDDISGKRTKKYLKYQDEKSGGAKAIKYTSPTKKESAAYKKGAKAEAKKQGYSVKNFKNQSEEEKARLEASGELAAVKERLSARKAAKDAAEAARKRELKIVNRGKNVAHIGTSVAAGGVGAAVTNRVAHRLAIKKGLMPGTPEYKAYVNKRTAIGGAATALATGIATRKAFNRAGKQVAMDRKLLK